MIPLAKVGDLVHYVSYGTPGGEYGSECRAAIVTALSGGMRVCLCVLNPGGLFFNQDVDYSDSHRGGTWHWPEQG